MSSASCACRTGRRGSSTCGASTAKNVCIVGLGSKDNLEKKEKKWGKSPWQALGATMKSVSKANKCATAALAVPDLSSTVIEDVCNGLLTGAYESTRFKSKPGSAASLKKKTGPWQHT